MKIPVGRKKRETKMGEEKIIYIYIEREIGEKKRKVCRVRGRKRERESKREREIGHNRHMNAINRRRMRDWISQQSSQIPWNGRVTQARAAFQDQFRGDRVIRARAWRAVVRSCGRTFGTVREGCVGEDVSSMEPECKR